MTRDELLRLVGRREIRRRPSASAAVDRPHHDPTMAPTSGLTPAISTPGARTYVYACRQGVAWAAWNDERERVPVTWFTWAEWFARGAQHPARGLATAAESEQQGQDEHDQTERDLSPVLHASSPRSANDTNDPDPLPRMT